MFHAPPLRKEVLELCKQLPFLQSLRNINSWIRRTNILNMECRLRLCVIVICTCTSLQAFLVTQSIFPTFIYLFAYSYTTWTSKIIHVFKRRWGKGAGWWLLHETMSYLHIMIEHVAIIIEFHEILWANWIALVNLCNFSA